MDAASPNGAAGASRSPAARLLQQSALSPAARGQIVAGAAAGHPQRLGRVFSDPLGSNVELEEAARAFARVGAGIVGAAAAAGEQNGLQ